MDAGTLVSYLVGRRRAIHTLASDPRTLKTGALLVLSAALAREYDAAYLVARPWVLALPWAVSLAASLVVFGALRITLGRPGDRGPTYRSFLALFWLTAPLAWLYAVPYERFLTPYDATVANLWTLALVAAWRVILISRVAAVLHQAGFSATFFVVMLVADVEALVITVVSPKPIIAIMGGLQHSPQDQLLVDMTLTVLMLGAYALPVLLILTLVFLDRNRPPREMPATEPAPSPGEWSNRLAWGSILVWVLVLPFTQAEQRLAWQVDRNLVAERLDEAFRVFREHPEEDFPPHFDPRPRFWAGEDEPDLWRVMEAMVEAPAPVPPWTYGLYLDKCRVDVANFLRPWDDKTLGRLARVLPRLPEGPELAAQVIVVLGRCANLASEAAQADCQLLSELAATATAGTDAEGSNG